MGGISNSFELFSTIHLATIIVLFCLIVYLFWQRRNLSSRHTEQLKTYERIVAGSLLAMEITYHIWLVTSGRWAADDSLPLELCSISLFVAIALLWTGNRYLVDFVVFAGIGGAIQAIATPVLDMNFPHFRFFHFFYTHAGIILTGLYFVWVKGYVPTFKGVIKTMMFLNIILPVIMVVNWLFDGNYMFLRMKPQNGSILDFLGPYPWYILSLEMVAFTTFVLIWLILVKDKRNGI
ncbi:TIGR02206 family membrane protein [Sporosarcina thermotolerans]|uniref:TIGR02206 family membrane protein n=1 Tax=Sporosarcina thermotolerans TaxID=633404 RepID=A0AAW9A3D0_9BACL|nr:TIGR02206 family membrane protein [Sporosarcina thermotolerans]MDW0115456.1 TIGR02206 family membrane protein [Sporosarcina thermotolerans]WHT47216.1 TIGR02206 family membrane protein [Sporosarcina thermotolerans]